MRLVLSAAGPVDGRVADDGLESMTTSHIKPPSHLLISMSNKKHPHPRIAKKTRLTRVALADGLREVRRFEASQVLTTQPTYEYGPHHPPECAALHLLLAELLITQEDFEGAVSRFDLRGFDGLEEPQFTAISRAGVSGVWSAAEGRSGVPHACAFVATQVCDATRPLAADVSWESLSVVRAAADRGRFGQ